MLKLIEMKNEKKPASNQVKKTKKAPKPPKRKPFDTIRIKVTRNHILWSTTILFGAIVSGALMSYVLYNNNDRTGTAANINPPQKTGSSIPLEEGAQSEDNNLSPIETPKPPSSTENAAKKVTAIDQENLSSTDIGIDLESGDHTISVSSLEYITASDDESPDDDIAYIAAHFTIANNSDEEHTYRATDFTLIVENTEIQWGESIVDPTQFKTITLEPSKQSKELVIIFAVDTHEGSMNWQPNDGANVPAAKVVFNQE